MSPASEKPIAILHGYRLDGSGSCIYVQNITRQFCQMGRNVVLVCQEAEPEKYDFISEAHEISDDGVWTSRFSRSTNYPGSATFVRPPLRGNLLPVYVDHAFPSDSNLKSFIRMSEEEVDQYVDGSVNAVTSVVDRFGVDVIYANHVIMMPFIASKVVSQRKSVRYFLIPHGSEIEYVIKKDKRFNSYAKSALENAAGIVSGSSEMTSRLSSLFQGGGKFLNSIHEVPVGVEVDYFSEPTRVSKKGCIQSLQEEIKRQITEASSGQEIASSSFVDELGRIDSEKDRVLVNFGRLISEKGVQDLLVIAPSLIKRNPNLKIIIAGEGPDRELFKKLISLLQSGRDKELHEKIAKNEMFRFVRQFLRANPNHVKENSSFAWAENVIFAGYLKHPALRCLLALSDVALFPSIVKEAYPLALMEAMATGTIPLVSNTAGLQNGLDRLIDLFGSEYVDRLRIPMEEEKRIQAILDQVAGVFDDLSSKRKEELIAFAKQKLGWKNVCEELLQVFGAAT